LREKGNAWEFYDFYSVSVACLKPASLHSWGDLKPAIFILRNTKRIRAKSLYLNLALSP